MLHIITEALRNSVLITGLVVVMMMMIESINIESRGTLFSGLKRTRTGQVIIAALLGAIPGCMGGFATVSLYTHRLFSFGALVAMMIASSGDEAFLMLAMIPRQALIITVILFFIAVATGIIIDIIWERRHRMSCDKAEHSACGNPEDCTDGYAIHEDGHSHTGHSPAKKHFTWKRALMLAGLAIFIAALASGMLGHEHGADSHQGHDGHAHSGYCVHHHEQHADHIEESFHIDLLSEDWMNLLFAGFSIIMLFVILFGSDHFVNEHLWNHVIRRHLPVIFSWTLGVLIILGITLQHFDINNWISDNTALMIILATLIGIIPESGPHMIFVTLFAAGVVPFPVLLASCISQDGHASIPLLAESSRSFIWAKVINCAVALIAGFTAMLFI